MQKYRRFVVELDIGLVPLNLNSAIIVNLIILEVLVFLDDIESLAPISLVD
jgi:hypothetical protein